MKISNLKQPYRRMAEYLVTQNYIQEASDGIYNLYKQGCVMDLFCNAIGKGEHPPITEQIKKYFPPNFDFSGEEVKTKPVMQMLDAETQKMIYTQLAKEGKFDQLSDTCEFSESVELEVWDSSQLRTVRQITGKYKDMYVDDDFEFWDNAKLPTPKIDFSQFKSGDVVEVETNIEIKLAYFVQIDNNLICLSSSKKLNHSEYKINKNDIKSITKIK